MADPPAQFPAGRKTAQYRLTVLQLLVKMGWQYLTPDEADRLRGERFGGTILEPVLVRHIREHCRFTFKGVAHPFSENAIQSAVQALKNIQAGGAGYLSEQAYDLLCLGTSVPQTVEGDTKSFAIDYIDWKTPANNTFHCTAGFRVERFGFRKYCIPDVVLYVNGIPLAVIACKQAVSLRSGREPVDQAIEQLADYQGKDGIPQLFLFCQLLLALSPDQARYGTTGAAPRFWTVWRESGLDKALAHLMDTPGAEQAMAGLLSHPLADRPAADRAAASGRRGISEAVRTLYALCRPARLLELTYKFILFDAGAKKIARYQQYFTVQEIIKRVSSAGVRRARPGGVVWHTQGSGKSLTMVMLAKSLVLHPEIVNPKIILVTDRIDLDDQLCSTFRACGLAVERAATGRHLVGLLNDRRTHVVTTLIHKFAAAVANRDLRPVDRNTFVLVDEGHRSQYSRQHARMRLTLKGACFIAFTGTPLAKKAKKNTFTQFGALFRPAYTIARAVQDRAVVPLLYEARHVPQCVDRKAVDRWFAKLTLGLAAERKADLKRKFSTKHQLDKALQRVRAIAWDISVHYAATYRNTGLKGQLAAPDKETAIRYKSFLDDFGLVVSEVLISAPAAREGEDRANEPSLNEKVFWRAMMDRFGSEKNYNRQLTNAFKYGRHPEIIIVVDKLLTGFDAPCNTVLYLARRLKEHTLLQAVARVNRLHPGKAHGLIVDYSGVIHELDRAIDFYGQLTEYDPADLEATVTDVHERIERLPQLQADMWDLFAAVKASKDPEKYEIHLRDRARRSFFHERFSQFARTLALALSTSSFLMSAPAATIRRYKADLTFFQNLRVAVSQRYQETVAPCEYEPGIKKLIDTSVGARDVQHLNSPINLLDAGQRARVLADETKSAGARTDMLAAATRQVIQQEMGRDPVFYKKFSKLLEEMIEAHQEGRLEAHKALQSVKDIAVKVATHTDDDIPPELVGNPMARRYYGCVREAMPAYSPRNVKPASRIAVRIAERLGRHKIRDWRTNPDAINKMRSEIDDILFDTAEASGLELTLELHDAIIDRCIEAAMADED